jgi:Phage integrase, N-terminal SAM-like domain
MPPPASRFQHFSTRRLEAVQRPGLLGHVRAVARVRHLIPRAEQAYSGRIRRLILFHRKRQTPEAMGAEETRLSLPRLAVEGRVAASTQSVGPCALSLLYRDVLGMEFTYVEGIERAKRPARVPVVFNRDEVKRPLAQLSGACGLIARLLYGQDCGLWRRCG